MYECDAFFVFPGNVRLLRHDAVQRFPCIRTAELVPLKPTEAEAYPDPLCSASGLGIASPNF